MFIVETHRRSDKTKQERLLLYELRTDRLESIIGTNPHWLFRPLLRFQEAHDTQEGVETPARWCPSAAAPRRLGRLIKLQRAVGSRNQFHKEILDFSKVS